jgi:hypothetical protein
VVASLLTDSPPWPKLNGAKLNGAKLNGSVRNAA